jgi:dTDP-4-dehydrorhamnose 3,5-epimerase
MIYKEAGLRGVFEILPEPRFDHRGFFMRTYDHAEFEKTIGKIAWVQENHSFSREKNILRGLHFQHPPFSEAKLVRAVSGKIKMIVLDLRKQSATFGQWNDFVISAANKKMLFVPRSFAMGMLTLTQNCSLLYKMDNVYAPDAQGCIKWDDPDLNIDWGAVNPVISERDEEGSSFKHFIQTFQSL